MGSRFDLGWLLIRFTAGILFCINHGAVKVFGEGKMAGFIQAIASLGFPFPKFFAWTGALTELIGGALFAVGLLTRPAAALAGFVMVVALYRHASDPFAKMELALIYLSIFIAGVLWGGGRYSLDRAVGVRLPFESRR